MIFYTCCPIYTASWKCALTVRQIALRFSFGKMPACGWKPVCSRFLLEQVDKAALAVPAKAGLLRRYGFSATVPLWKFLQGERPFLPVCMKTLLLDMNYHSGFIRPFPARLPAICWMVSIIFESKSFHHSKQASDRKFLSEACFISPVVFGTLWEIGHNDV